MKIRILQVFYGADNLPYKDQARTVHYPITGNGFQNANNTTQIRFYTSQLSGENTTWVAVSKLPNGKIGSKVLETFIDDELNEPYALLELDSYYTQYKGDVFISLQGYQGNVQVTYDEETEIYEISGTPTIAATGSIKFTNNYAPSFVGSGQEQNITLQQLLGYLSSKADIGNTIYVVADIEDEDLSGYEDGQTIYDLFTDLYYEVNSEVEDGYEPANGNGLLGNKGALIRFFGLTDTITLQQIYNLIGANRYGALNVDDKEYLVIMSANNSIKAYDLLNKKLFDYIDAPNDTFADVLNEIPTTFVEHRNEGSKVYGTNASAQDTTIPYSALVVNNGIVQRESTGQISVPTTPTQSYHATSKSYVDSNYGKKVQLTIDNETFVLTVKLLNNFDTPISTASVDLPLESIVVSAQYYDTYTYEGTTYTKVLVIVLATTDTPIIVPVGDLVSGLVSESTFNDAVAQLQTNINKCVQQTNTASVVYGTNGSGNQVHVKYGTASLTNGLVQRDSRGQITTYSTPTNNTDVANKQYVDTFGRTLEFSINNTTYVMTFRLKDNNGNVISTQNIDLPLETMVVDGSYDDTTESLILELKNGQTITIPISDLISGLVTDTSLATTLANYYTKAQIDQMVAGFVFADVDDFLSDSSTNPVENRVITNALDQKANTQDLLDGSLIPNKALAAQQIENVSEESGVVQETPFINQGTSTSNNTEETPTAPVAKQLEKQGNSVVVNQLVQNWNFASSSGWVRYNGSFSVANNKGTFLANAQYGWVRHPIPNLIKDHYYRISFDITLTTPSTEILVGLMYNYSILSGSYKRTISSTAKQTLTLNYKAADSYSNMTICFMDERASGWDNIVAENVTLVDLTQHFGSNDAIPQDLLDHPEHWSWYSNTNNAYNTGSLDNSTGRYLVCTGRNQWDEEWEVGGIGNNGENVISSSNIRSKNYISVIPNKNYYAKISTTGNITIYRYDKDKNFISSRVIYKAYASSFNENNIFGMPSDCVYIRFAIENTYGTTYNHDITISVYYTTGDGYDQYYPYVAPKVYYTGTEVLRSVPIQTSPYGVIRDYKTPDGTIHRLVGAVDLGDFTWTAKSNDRFETTLSSLSKPLAKAVSTTLVPTILCGRYEAKAYYKLLEEATNGINIWSDGDYLEIKETGANNNAATLKTMLSGVMLYYELETPTTEQGTPFAENIEVDDYGTMYWLDTNNELVGIPQGTKLFYPADYVLLMDDLNIYTNGDVSKLALKTDLASDKQELSTVDSQLKEALGGTLRQLLVLKNNVGSGSLLFGDTKYVDLGDYNWIYAQPSGANPYFYAIISDIKNVATQNDVGNLMCVAYRTVSHNGGLWTSSANKVVFTSNDGHVVEIVDKSYTDPTTFKNAMKGVLLAYEKAS